MASPMASIRSSNQSKIGHHLRKGTVLLQNVPDVKRCRQGEDQARKNDTGCSKFKAAKFPIIKICGAQFDEEQNDQYGINYGENHVIDNGLNLSFCGVPGALNGTGYIAGGRGCKRRDRHGGDQQRKNQKDKDRFGKFMFHGILLPRSVNPALDSGADCVQCS